MTPTTKRRIPKQGGGGDPPQGGLSIRRLPFRGAKRARCKSYLGTLAKLLSFIWQVSQFWPQKFLSPSLNLFPGGGGSPQARPKKVEKFAFFDFLVDFFAFRNASRIRPPKKLRKNAKNTNFGLPKPSQNGPKTPPKARS